MSCRFMPVMVAAATFAFTVVFASAVHAEFFDGDNSDDFNDPLNWNNNVLPGTNTTDPDAAIIGSIEVGAANPATATISGPLTIPTIGDLRVGNGAAGNGTLNQSAGEITPQGNKWAFVGVDGGPFDPSIGRYNLTGTGKFTHVLTDNNFDTGNFFLGIGGGRRDVGAGDLRNEGYLSVEDQAEFTVNNFHVGNNDEGHGQVDQTGGTVLANDWIAIGRETGAVGVYNMSGGSLTVNIDGITVGESTGATGEMNLSGDASVTTPRLRVGRSLVTDQTDGGGNGTLTIAGNQVTISTGSFDLGTDDGVVKDGEGVLRFESNSSGISPIIASGDVTLNDGSVTGFAMLEVDFLTDPLPSGSVELIDVGGILAGTFMGLPHGTIVPNSGGRTISYTFGDGNDIGLVDSNASTPGDQDGDLDVDGADFLAIQQGFGTATTAADFDDWEANYGAGVPASAATGAIPEPATLSLIAMLLGLGALHRRRSAPIVGL